MEFKAPLAGQLIRAPDARHRLAGLLKQLGVAALYALLARIVFAFFSSDGLISAFWPSSGLSLAVLLIGGKRYYGSVYLGALLANAMAGANLLAAATIAAGNTFEALTSVWLLTRYSRFDTALQTLRGYLLLLLAACIGSIGSALSGATTMLLAGYLTHKVYFPNLAHWWMGDVLGIALITPLILVFWHKKNDWREAKRLGEAAALLGLTFVAGQIIFLGWFHASVGHVAKGYMMFLLITLVAMRLGTPGTVIALPMIAIQALLGAHRGVGFFANDLAQTHLAHSWLFLLILSVVGMALATFLAEQQAAEKKLQDGKNQLQATLDAIPDLLFEVGLDGFIYSYHSRRTDLLAAPPKTFMGNKYFDVLPPDVASVCQSAIAEAHQKGHSTGKQYELSFSQNKRWFELSVSSKPVYDGQKPRFIVLARDITERKQMEEVLHLNKLIIDTAMNGFWMVNSAGNLQRVNEAYAKMSGYTTDELLGMHISQLEIKEAAQEIGAHIEKIIAQGFDRFETRHRRKDGKIFDVEVAVVFMPETQMFFGFLRDITERKADKQQLHDLNAHLLNVREDEKIHIAREIHDDLGGTLNALKADVYWLSKRLTAYDDTAALIGRFEAMAQRIDSAINFTRHLIDDMRPAVLDDLGLLAAIEWQAAEFSQNTGIDCQINCIEDEANLDKQRSIALFRIFQEALANISRHARASRVKIEFFHSKCEVLLTVSDNGCGMAESLTATKKLYKSKSYGLLGMKERVEQLDGRITFSNPPGGGFSIDVSIPLPDAKRGIQ